MSVLGHGGPGDKTDGNARLVSYVTSVDTTVGGNDTITTGVGPADLVIGGVDADSVTTNRGETTTPDGNAIVIGDNGFVDYAIVDGNPAEHRPDLVARPGHRWQRHDHDRQWRRHRDRRRGRRARDRDARPGCPAPGRRTSQMTRRTSRATRSRGRRSQPCARRQRPHHRRRLRRVDFGSQPITLGLVDDRPTRRSAATTGSPPVAGATSFSAAPQTT